MNNIQCKDIPGWFSNKDISILKSIVKDVPVNGTIIEIGPFIGRSTCCICEVKNEGVKLHCIDLWDNEAEMHCKMKIIKNLQQKFKCKILDIYPYEVNFIKNTKQYENDITRYNEDIKHFKISIKADLIFLDAIHEDKELKDVIRYYYYNVLKENGYFSGHDFSSDFPYRQKCLIELSKEFNCNLIIPENNKSSVWYFKKEKSEYAK